MAEPQIPNKVVHEPYFVGFSILWSLPHGILLNTNSEKWRAYVLFLVAQSDETQQKNIIASQHVHGKKLRHSAPSQTLHSLQTDVFLSSVPKQVNKKLAQLHKNSPLKKPLQIKTSNTFWSHLVSPHPSDFITALHLEKSHSKNIPHQNPKSQKRDRIPNAKPVPLPRFPPPLAVHSKDAPPAPGLVSPKLNSQTLTKVGPKSPVRSTAWNAFCVLFFLGNWKPLRPATIAVKIGHLTFQGLINNSNL